MSRSRSRLATSLSCNAIMTSHDAASRDVSRASSVLSTTSTSYNRASTPTMASYYNAGYSRTSNSRFSSRATTPTTNPDNNRILRSRSPTPCNTYSDLLITASRRQRQRSIPPPAPPPEKIEPVPVPTFGKPPAGPRVVASDYYRGKVKSIYEREPLFKEFSRNVSDRGYSMYNSEHLDRMKGEFKDMVEDKYRRMKFNDPSVGRDAGTKLYPWNNILHKEMVPASQRLGEKHSLRAREPSPIKSMPRITLYHKSTYRV